MTLDLRQVSKTFPGQKALRAVDLSVEYGEVHALVGQNGSGKSTLIKILSGYHQPDPGGSASFEGRTLELGSAAAARAAGLRFVHQDLGLVLTLSLLENMMLGRPYPTGVGGRIRWRDCERRVEIYLHRLGVTARLSTPVRDLTLAERTAVAIARALMDTIGDRLILVLDEPTAALPADEISRLLDVIDRLRGQGHGVLLVSHHLDEVLQIADRVTVLRDGEVVAAVHRSELDYDRLTELIVGHPVLRGRRPNGPAGPAVLDRGPVLTVRGLSGPRVDGVDLEVRAGQIVGVAGITGSGREMIGPLLSGRLSRRGTMVVGSRTVRPADPKRALECGVAGIPGERGQFGVIPNLSVRANMTISKLDRHRRFGRVRRGAERAEVSDWIHRLSIVTQGGEAPISSLSGGNQQKVLVARALRLDPVALILDDPTVGIDVGARAQIHEVVRACAADGIAVLLISTDSDELASLADRVLIMSRGRVVRVMESGPELTSEAIDVEQLALARA